MTHYHMVINGKRAPEPHGTRPHLQIVMEIGHRKRYGLAPATLERCTEDDWTEYTMPFPEDAIVEVRAQ